MLRGQSNPASFGSIGKGKVAWIPAFAGMTVSFAGEAGLFSPKRQDEHMLECK